MLKELVCCLKSVWQVTATSLRICREAIKQHFQSISYTPQTNKQTNKQVATFPSLVEEEIP